MLGIAIQGRLFLVGNPYYLDVLKEGVWPEIEKAIPQILNHKLQVVRLKTEDNLKYIGKFVVVKFVIFNFFSLF